MALGQQHQANLGNVREHRGEIVIPNSSQRVEKRDLDAEKYRQRRKSESFFSTLEAGSGDGQCVDVFFNPIIGFHARWVWGYGSNVGFVKRVAQ